MWLPNFKLVVQLIPIVLCLNFPTFLYAQTDLQNIQLVEFPLTDQTNCVGTPSGSTIINASINGAEIAEGGYTFQLFQGQNTFPANEIASSDIVSVNATSDQATISQLPAGIYTVLVTDNETDLTNSLEFVIAENLPNLVISNATITPNTTCQGTSTFPNGSIFIAPFDVFGSTGSLSFEWYFGTSINAANLIVDGVNILNQISGVTNGAGVVSGATTNNIQNLAAGNYAVRAIDDNTGCTSAPITISITDNIVPTLINTTVVQDDFSCDATSPTGAVLANVIGGDVEQTLEWFVGTQTAAPGEASPNRLPFAIASASQVAGANNIQGLPAGVYTVRATNNSTQCFETSSVSVIRSVPVVSASVIAQAQTDCTPNGEVIASTPSLAHLVFSNGFPAGLTPNYAFQWFLGQDTSVPLIGETSATLSSVAAGFYTLIVTETNSGCTSLPITAEVADGISANSPVVVPSLDIVPSTCVSGTGQITGTVVINALGNSLSFEWYEGAQDFAGNPSLGTPLFIGAQLQDGNVVTDVTINALSATLGGISSGLYTLVVTDDVTGCTSQTVFDLPYNDIQVAATMVIDHITRCPDNGAAIVSLADQIDIDYQTLSDNFQVGDSIIGNISGAIAFVNSDNTINQLSASVFSGAFSIGESIIGSKSQATASITNITNVGFIDGDVDDISEYDLYLYGGNGVPADPFTPVTVDGFTSPTIISGGSLLPGSSVRFEDLPAGTYTAIAREKIGPVFNPVSTDQCFSISATGTVDQRAFEPLITDFSIVDNTICDVISFAGNGSVSVTASRNAGDVFLSGDFAFQWFVGTDTSSGPPIQIEAGTSTSTISSLAPGFYTVAVERLGLPESALAINVTSGAFMTGEIITGSVSGATAKVDRFINDTQDTLAIFTVVGGPFFDTDLITGTISGATATIIPNGVIAGGTAGNGCVSLSTFQVQNLPEVPAILGGTVLNVDQCAPNNVGSITITDSDISPGNAADFTYEWFFESTSTTALNETGNVLSDLVPGTYFVSATNNSSGCKTSFFEFEVENVAVEPIVSLFVGAVDTSCENVGDSGNGSIRFEITNAISGDFSFQWFKGSDTSTPVSGSGISGVSGTVNSTTPTPFGGTLSGINGGTYTLEVIDLSSPNNQCAVLCTFVLEEQQAVIGATGTINASSNCDGNGSFEVTDVTENGISANDLSNFVFTFTFADGSPIALASFSSSNGGTNNMISNLSAGEYQVLVTNSVTSCVSDPIAFVIEDITVDPLVTATNIVDNTACLTGNGGNGSIAISITDGTTVPGPSPDFEFDIVWYRNSVDPNNQIFPDISAPNAGTASVVPNSGGLGIENLSGDTYVVVVTDNTSPNNQCATTETFILNSNPSIISLNNAFSAAGNNTNCGPAFNGFIDVTGVLVNGIPITSADFGNYAFSFSSTGGGALPPTATVTSNSGGLIGSVLQNLPAGDYEVIITDLVTSCTSEPFEFTIEDEAVAPLVTASTIVDNTTCLTGISGNGSLTISVTDGATSPGPSPASEFDIIWYRSSVDPENQIFPDIGAPNAGSASVVANTAGVAIENLSSDTYVVVVTDNTNPNNQCVTTESFIINDNPPIISLNDASFATSANTSCNPNFNGFIDITGVVVNGVAESAANFGNYTFSFRSTGGGALPPTATVASNSGGLTGSVLQNLPTGDYEAIITDVTTSCTSEPFEFIIEDASSNPEVAVITNNPDTSAPNDQVGNGSIAVSVGNSPSAFDFVWYRGSSLADEDQIFPTAGSNAGSASITPGSNNTGLENLAADVYTVMVTDNTAPNLSCTTVVSIEVESRFEWIGVINTDWNNAGNWSTNTIPSSTDDIIIPDVSSLANAPDIDEAVTIAGLNIEEEGILTISSEFLQINDSFINNGSLSSASGAAVILMGTRSGVGIENISRNLNGNAALSIVGSPVNGVTIGDLEADHVFDYDNAGQVFSSPASGDGFNPGDGYFVGSNEESYSVTLSGELSSGTVNVPVTRAVSSDDGFQLIANPYGAPLGVAAFFNNATNANLTTGTLYLWDDGGINASTSSRGGDYVTVNLLGAVSGTIDLGDGVAGQNGANAFNGSVGTMQGFFIEATSDGMIAFTPDMQTNIGNNDANFFRVNGNTPTIKLSLTGEGIYDELLLGLHAQATSEQDYGLDARKFSGSDDAFYSMIGEEKFAIQAVSSKQYHASIIQLGFDAAKAGNYRIEVNAMEGIQGIGKVILHDAVLQQSYELTPHLQIPFVLNQAAANNKRFSISFEPTVEEVPSSNSLEILAFKDDTELHIGYPGAEEKTTVYDLSGKIVYQEILDFSQGSAMIRGVVIRDRVYILRVGTEVIKFLVTE